MNTEKVKPWDRVYDRNTHLKYTVKVKEVRTIGILLMDLEKPSKICTGSEIERIYDLFVRCLVHSFHFPC